jgi:hypothetical protein
MWHSYRNTSVEIVATDCIALKRKDEERKKSLWITLFLSWTHRLLFLSFSLDRVTRKDVDGVISSYLQKLNFCLFFFILNRNKTTTSRMKAICTCQNDHTLTMKYSVNIKNEKKSSLPQLRKKNKWQQTFSPYNETLQKMI